MPSSRRSPRACGASLPRHERRDLSPARRRTPRATGAGSSCGSPPSPHRAGRPRPCGSPGADGRGRARAGEREGRRRDLPSGVDGAGSSGAALRSGTPAAREKPRRSSSIATPRVCATSIPTFPFAISRSARFSSSWSATIRFSLTFSRSSSFRRLASCAFKPPSWARQRCSVCSETSSCLATSATSQPSPEQPVGLPELPDHPLRRVPAPSPLSHRFDCPPCP